MTSTILNSTATVDLDAARKRNLRTWQESSRLLYAGRIEEFVQYWTPDASYEAALPVAVITGRDALRAAFSALVASATSITVHDVVFHQTADPDVAFVEERMTGVLSDGWRYENRLAIRVQFSGEQIAYMLEYYGQFAHAELLSHLGF